MKFLIANQKFLILKFLLASLMIYDDTQFANSLARVEIVFTLVGIEAITILVELIFDTQEKNVWFQKISIPPSHGRSMETPWGWGGGSNRWKFPRGWGVFVLRIFPQHKEIHKKMVSEAQSWQSPLRKNNCYPGEKQHNQ